MLEIDFFSPSKKKGEGGLSQEEHKVPSKAADRPRIVSTTTNTVSQSKSNYCTRSNF